MVYSWVRGNRVFRDKSGCWRYDDSKEPAKDNRPCAKCGRHPTKDGYDACIGHIDDPNVISACCGHGKHTGVVIVKNKTNATYITKGGQGLDAHKVMPHTLDESMTSLDEVRKGETTKGRM